MLLTMEPREALAALGVYDAGKLWRATGGLDTEVWRVERPGGACALRLFRAGQARVAHREAAALRAAAAGGIPVPAVLAEGTHDARPLLLLAWCPGRTLAASLQATPWRVWTLGRQLGALHARIHALSPPASLPTWLEWSGPVEPALRRAIDSAQPRDGALLHLDYHPLNVLVVRERLGCVLDWVNARAGDPRADLARTEALLLAPPLAPGLARPAVRALLRLLAAAWRVGYVRAAGPPHDLAAFRAWAAATMARDLESHLGKPGSGVTPEYLVQLRRRAQRLLRAATR
jgi:aminoglycoside phosphotransferase (APT) family kinase protein